MSIQQLFNENLNLRKALNLATLGLEKTESDYNHIKEIYEDMVKTHQRLTNDYQKLQRHSQSLTAEHRQIQRELQNKVTELKELIEQKQHELEEIQIKIIPNLDQDMLRVKIINEMEGPYQENMARREQQIYQLTNKLHETQRKLSLVSLQLEDLKLQKDQQIETLRLFYHSQVTRLNGRLEGLTVTGQGREKDRQLNRKLRKDVQEARTLLQIREDEMAEMSREKDILREEVTQLRIKLSTRNNNENSEKALYQIQLHKLNQQAKGRDIDLQKALSQVSRQKQATRNKVKRIQQLEMEIDKMKQSDNRLQNTIKENEQRLKHHQEMNEELKINVKRLNSQIDSLRERNQQYDREITQLKNKQKQTKQFDYHEKMEEFSQKRPTNKREDSLNSTIEILKKENTQLREKIREIQEKRNEGQKKHEEKRNQNHEKTQNTRILQEKVKILKAKLKQANNKIVELLKQKISQQEQIQISAETIPPTYEVRDAALVPLIQPIGMPFDPFPASPYSWLAQPSMVQTVPMPGPYDRVSLLPYI